MGELYEGNKKPRLATGWAMFCRERDRPLDFHLRAIERPVHREFRVPGGRHCPVYRLANITVGLKVLQTIDITLRHSKSIIKTFVKAA